jgi:hypothetical protein
MLAGDIAFRLDGRRRRTEGRFWSIDPFAAPSTNGRFLRKPDIADRSRDIAIWGKFAGRGRETARTDKSNWADL